ncbi:hypothetical protein [Thalassiella azotivora]
MRLTTRDLVGAVLLAAIAIPYVGYLVNGSMPFVQDPRGMAAIGLVLGTAAFLVLRRGDPADRVGRVEIGLAAVAGVLGLVALALAETAAAEVWLAVFMVALLAVFAVELLDHAGLVPGHDTATRAVGA